MSASVGLGYYGRKVTPTNGLGLYLVHLLWQTAAALRAQNPWATIIGRADVGRDDQQIDWRADATVAADRFVDERIIPMVQAAGPGVYSILLGPNESFPGHPQRESGESNEDYAQRLADYREALSWRAELELRICRRVQYGSDMPAWWRNTPYAWGSVNVGALEAEDLEVFAQVWREAWCVNIHGYLAPHVRMVEQESEPYYLWRPTRIWLPELKRLGITLNLLLGECGTYYPELDRTALAHLDVDIHRAMTAECSRLGVRYLGAIAYGVGQVGNQEPWELESTEYIFTAAAKADGEQSSGGVVSPPVPTEAPTGGETVSEAEFVRVASDVYARHNAAWNPDSAFCKFWLAETRAGRYPGAPEGPEQRTENGEYAFVFFAGTAAYCKVGDWGNVQRGLPPFN